ncbi:MAG: protoheme IX farnesyltransferase [Planctomycetaceae bacterium]|jgi:protoheme IX farnesyltransferase|nr:protoheme IX farnesyltransferase [Planctomycetaceae bacterium]
MSSASVTTELSGRVAAMPLTRFGDYLQLSKPRIAVMGMVAVAVGYFVGCEGSISTTGLMSACFGIASVAVSCSFLNQWYEQDTDRRMARTADRPVPGGRVRPLEVLAVGLLLMLAGVGWLAVAVNMLTAVLAFVTLALYVVAYTPLKRVSSLCTVIGAVSGAMPPVLGWTAAGGSLDGGALALFLLLFTWQFPHFLAIATIYRKDYESAGLRMLPLVRGDSNGAGFVGVVYASVLIPVSLMVWHQDLAGNLYLTVALMGGLVYLLSSIRFLLDQSTERAKQLVLCSIVYLPTVLLTMTWDHYRLLS